MPVLEDKADEVYHSPQSSTKRTVDHGGKADRCEGEFESKGGCGVLRPLARRDINVKFGKLLEGDLNSLRVAFLRWAKKP